MCDSDFTTHKTDKFTEEEDCKEGVDCTSQPFEPDDFVLEGGESEMFCGADPRIGAWWL